MRAAFAPDEMCGSDCWEKTDVHEIFEIWGQRETQTNQSRETTANVTATAADRDDTKCVHHMKERPENFIFFL